ncbi:MAG: FAD binding domain-containing protein, partial [Anaerolineae bacterium]
MHWIDYVSPHSVREATELLAEYGERARILAGGTDLLVLLRGGLMDSVNLVVDGKSIPELNEVTYDPQTGLTLGAAVPCYKIYNNQAVARAYPGLIDASSLIGGTQ